MQNSELKNTIQSDNTKHKILLLVGCLAVSGLICFAHILGNTVFLALSILAFLGLNVLSCFQDAVFPFLLYFLPWSPLLKLEINGISFFTIALLFSCLFYLVKCKFSLNIYQIVLTATLLAITLIAKTIQHNSIANSYFVFMAMLLLFPCITNKAKENLSIT